MRIIRAGLHLLALRPAAWFSILRALDPRWRNRPCEAPRPTLERPAVPLILFKKREIGHGVKAHEVFSARFEARKLMKGTPGSRI